MTKLSCGRAPDWATGVDLCEVFAARLTIDCAQFGNKSDTADLSMLTPEKVTDTIKRTLNGRGR